MSVSLKDIANIAEVSPQVVSAVLNNKNYMRISQERRKKIWDIANELGYRPNLQAKSLRNGKSASVGIFLPNWKELQLFELLKGVASASNKTHIPYHTFFGLSFESYCNFLDLMTSAKHTGIVSYNPRYDIRYPEIKERLQNFINNGGKVIFIKSQTKELDGAIYIDVDDKKGGILASEYLRKNKRWQNFITFSFTTSIHNERILGFSENIEKDKIKSIVFEHLNIREIQNKISQEFDKANKPLAIFSSSNQFTSIILQECTKRNWKYDVDYTLVSYDLNTLGGDTENFARIIQPFDELGNLAFEHIDAMLRNKKLDKKIIDPYIKINNIIS